MKPLTRITFRTYIMSFIEKRPPDSDEDEFPISNIDNRNPEQVPDELWQELIISHIVSENLS